MGRRLITGVLVTAFLAGLGAPCFAAGDDPDAAIMACCRKQHHAACEGASIAQACCASKAAGDQDRLVPAAPVASREAADLSMMPVSAISAPLLVAVPVALDVFPTRSDGIAARSAPLRI